MQHSLWVPAIHRALTGGVEVIAVGGADVGSALAAADAAYPGLWACFVEGGQLRRGIAVAVNGDISPQGLRRALERPSEIHFVRAAAGGQEVPTSWRWVLPGGGGLESVSGGGAA
jgi:hypothetical protein